MKIVRYCSRGGGSDAPLGPKKLKGAEKCVIFELDPLSMQNRSTFS